MDAPIRPAPSTAIFSMPGTLCRSARCHQRMMFMAGMRVPHGSGYRRGMQIEALDVLRTVVRHGSITGAARELRYTQSAVSRQIAALEAEFGVVLFDRLPRGVALTEEGRRLLPHVEAVLDRLTTARRELDALRGLGGGRLRVGAFPTRWPRWSPAPWRRSGPRTPRSASHSWRGVRRPCWSGCSPVTRTSPW